MASIRIITSTTYSIEVAAVNSVDTGPYSDPITEETPQSKCSVCCISMSCDSHSWYVQVYISV